MIKRHALTQALAALLALAGLLWGMLSLETYCQAERQQPLADCDAALSLLVARASSSPQQRSLPEATQAAVIFPESPQVAAVALQEGDSTIKTQERAVRLFKGISEGDAIIGELTHYCAGRCCNGKWAGITADGTVLDDDTPPIVGCNWLPLGAVIEFGGQEYRVADHGGESLSTVGRLDVYTPEGHQAALDKGRLRGVEITIISLPG